MKLFKTSTTLPKGRQKINKKKLLEFADKVGKILEKEEMKKPKMQLIDTTKINTSYFFKKIKNKVYKFTKIGDGNWKADLTPYEQEPYIYWSGNEPKTSRLRK